MPSAWEGPSLTHNLGVLAELARRPVGTKLKFDSDSGKFDIDERYLISRTFSWDSVKSESHFATPMGRLLRAAQEQIGTGRVTQVAFDDALAGLAQLRTTYAGAADKVRALDKVLKSVEGVAPLVREAGDKGEIVVNLRRDYQRHLVYAIRQRNYLDVNQGDVCHAFVIDWGRRVLAGKASYAASRKHPTFAAATSLSRAEHVRMQKKVDRVAVQQEVERARLAQGDDVRTSFPPHEKFGSVRLPGMGATEVRVGAFERTARGQNVFRAILEAARAYSSSPGERVFLVRLDGPSAVGSHMLGLHLSGGGLADVHLFDPNVGEFRFMPGAETPFREFCDALMARLYTDRGVLLFDSWVIRRLYRNT
jgi:hypothetical protein